MIRGRSGDERTQRRTVVAVLLCSVVLMVSLGLLPRPAGSNPLVPDHHSIRPDLARPTPPLVSSARPHSASVATAGNRTIGFDTTNLTLPGWNSLSSYAWNCNSNVSNSVVLNCFTPGDVHLGYAGTQVPLLSWTADGAFYVNTSFDLVFYSFVNHTVTRIAPWLALYDAVMWYAGVTNTEFLTTDGSYIYEFGCLETNCLRGSDFPVVSYAVNVTTGRTFEHQWGDGILTGTGNHLYTPYWNAQMNMVGLNGNDSIMTLTVTSSPHGFQPTNGTIWAYNIWTGVEWKVADLPFFEANNLYWIPEFEEFFDVSADDTSNDAVFQVLLSGPPEAPVATIAGPFAYSAQGYGIGGVGGLWLNLSSDQVAFSTDWQGHGEEFGIVTQLGPTGVITGFPRASGPFYYGAEPAPTSGEHRSALVTDGRADVTPTSQEPTAWLGDPNTNFTFWSTNVSQSFAAWNVDGSLFYNTSYSILTTSDNCNRVGTAGTDCSLEGTAGGTTPGTVTWSWREGLPEFPFPSNAPLAEPNDPAPWIVSANPNATHAVLAWSPPKGTLDPPVNFTVSWGTANENHHTALPAGAAGFTIPGLLPNETVHYRVDVWNLHGRSSTSGSVTTLVVPVPRPPQLSLFSMSFRSSGTAGFANALATLVEHPSPGWPISNDTLRWGLAPSALTQGTSAETQNLSGGSGLVVWVVEGLALNVTYYFGATSWDIGGESGPSAIVSVHTLTVPARQCVEPCRSVNLTSGPLWPVALTGLVVLAALAVMVAAWIVVDRRGMNRSRGLP